MIGFGYNPKDGKEEKMGLTRIITKIMEDSEKRKNTSETWELLKKKLKKNSYKEGSEEYDKAMGEISQIGAYNILGVWEALDKYINKNGNRWGGTSNYRDENITMMRKLCEIENVEEVIKTLGETGYDSLKTYSGDVYTYVRLSDNNLEAFKMFSSNGLYKRYSKVFNALKNLGYKDIKSYDTTTKNQLDYLVEISKLNGDAVGAVHVLASNGYQIDQVIGVSRRDVQNVTQIIGEAKNEKGGIPAYLYEKGILKTFQDYFTGLSNEDKKSAIGTLLEYEAKEPTEGMKGIQKWIEENHKELLAEAGLF